MGSDYQRLMCQLENVAVYLSTITKTLIESPPMAYRSLLHLFLVRCILFHIHDLL